MIIFFNCHHTHNHNYNTIPYHDFTSSPSFSPRITPIESIFYKTKKLSSEKRKKNEAILSQKIFSFSNPKREKKSPKFGLRSVLFLIVSHISHISHSLSPLFVCVCVFLRVFLSVFIPQIGNNNPILCSAHLALG